MWKDWSISEFAASTRWCPQKWNMLMWVDGGGYRSPLVHTAWHDSLLVKTSYLGGIVPLSRDVFINNHGLSTTHSHIHPRWLCGILWALPSVTVFGFFFQVTTWDWTRAEKSFTVYEIMCKILKVRRAPACKKRSSHSWRCSGTHFPRTSPDFKTKPPNLLLTRLRLQLSRNVSVSYNHLHCFICFNVI